MLRSIAAGFTAGLFFASQAALADGMSIKDTPPPVEACCSANWTGFYGAAGIGYSWQDTDVDWNYYQHSARPYRAGDETFSDSANVSSDDDGVTGSIAIGYDHLIHDRFLIGAFADYTFGDYESSHALPLGDRIDLTLDDIWSVGGRIGFVRCCTLFYAMAGYTSGDASMATLLHDESDRLDGYFIGAGIEHNLHRGLFLRAEYRYSDFGDLSSKYYDEPCAACGGFFSEDLDSDFDMHTFQIGLVYKFGREREVVEPLK